MERGAWWATVHSLKESDTTEEPAQPMHRVTVGFSL